MLEKEDLAEQGIEVERTDVDKCNIANEIKQSLREKYSNRHEHMAYFEDEMKSAIKMNIWIQPIAGLLIGKGSIAIIYALMLGVILITAEMIDCSKESEYLDELSGRFGRSLKVSTLIIGSIATASFITPTASFIQKLMVGWSLIWIGGMWLLLLKTVIWGIMLGLVNYFVRDPPF